MSPSPHQSTRSIVADAGKFAAVVGALWTLATYAADRQLGPTRSELHYHIQEVAREMAPGGAMHDRIARMDKRDEYIVEAIAAICHDTGSNCPAPTKLVQAP